MSVSDSGAAAPVTQPDPPSISGSADGAPGWLEHVQRTRRHAAIARMQTWSSYQNWAEQVRGSWNEATSETALIAEEAGVAGSAPLAKD